MSARQDETATLHRLTPILVPIALFSSLSRQVLGTRIEGPFDSRAEDLPAKREKGYGDENAR